MGSVFFCVFVARCKTAISTTHDNKHFMEKKQPQDKSQSGYKEIQGIIHKRKRLQKTNQMFLVQV